MNSKTKLLMFKALGSFKVFGSAVVSSKGQVVIPASARRELGIDSGGTLLVCAAPHGEGLFLVKADTIEQILSIMNERLAELEKMTKEHKTLATTDGKRRSG